MVKQISQVIKNINIHKEYNNMGGSSSSSGGGGGSSRNTNYVTFPSGKRVSYTPYVKDSKGRPIRTGSGGYVRRGTYTPVTMTMTEVAETTIASSYANNRSNRSTP